MSDESIRLLQEYSYGNRFLEIGCALGDDAIYAEKLGYNVTALDVSQNAIKIAKSKQPPNKVSFICSDYFDWYEEKTFNIVYERGVFHNIQTSQHRDEFAAKTSAHLDTDGLWVSVVAAINSTNEEMIHNGVLLQDVINAVESYFDILEIKKTNYGLANSTKDFDAWHCAFRRR